MKIISVLFALAALAINGSCKKKTIEYTIQGTVQDASFGTAASGSTVTLYEIAPGSAISTPLSSAVVGADGSYSFTIKREKIEKYRLSFTKSNYFPEAIEFSLKDLDPKTPTSYTTQVWAKSWVKLVFNNPDNVGNLKVVKTSGKSGCDECCTFGEFYLYSNVSDSTIYCINNGNTAYSYHWFLLQTTTHAEASVITVPFDTTELVLEY